MGKNLLFTLIIFICAIVGFIIYGTSPGVSLTDNDSLISYKNGDHKSYVDGDTLTIVTYNIGYLSGMTNNLPLPRNEDFFEDNLSVLIDHLKQIDADFFGFQEVDFASDRSYQANQLDSIGFQVSYLNSFRSVNWNKRYVPFPYWPPSVHFGKMLSGQAILSKFPITKYGSNVLVKPENESLIRNMYYLDRLLQIAEIELTESINMTLVNVHLEAFDRETRLKHAEELKKLILSKLTENQPLIVIGDFNSDPAYIDSNDAMKVLEIDGIKSAINQTDYYTNHSYTFSTGNPDKMIDYILYSSKHLTKVSARVLEEFGEISDHFPVEMKFVINAENDQN